MFTRTWDRVRAWLLLWQPGAMGLCVGEALPTGLFLPCSATLDVSSEICSVPLGPVFQAGDLGLRDGTCISRIKVMSPQVDTLEVWCTGW